MTFTDQKPRLATKQLCETWGGNDKGKRFRCYLCGHKFVPGDIWRWVYSGKYTNFLVCKMCDGDNVLDRWEVANDELKRRFWWACE